ncbi:MAG: macro domain-containing protein, partial [Patescibacteria group bacterium]|nr:macro domain-containing protein [Patescibacteria group bacterium]
GHVPVGSAVITTSGKLPCKAVIHTVGPKMGEGDEDNKLKNAVISSLTLASQKGFRSLSMPAISAGIYGFPKNRCADILVSESKKFFSDNPKTTLETIEFCIYEDETLSYFTKQFDLI